MTIQEKSFYSKIKFLNDCFPTFKFNTSVDEVIKQIREQLEHASKQLNSQSHTFLEGRTVSVIASSIGMLLPLALATKIFIQQKFDLEGILEIVASISVIAIVFFLSRRQELAEERFAVFINKSVHSTTERLQSLLNLIVSMKELNNTPSQDLLLKCLKRREKLLDFNACIMEPEMIFSTFLERVQNLTFKSTLEKIAKHTGEIEPQLEGEGQVFNANLDDLWGELDTVINMKLSYFILNGTRISRPSEKLFLNIAEVD